MILRIIGVIAVVIVVLAMAQRLWGPPTWDDVAEQCLEDLDAITCACIVTTLEEEGYEPGDIDGEDFSPSAFQDVLPCLL